MNRSANRTAVTVRVEPPLAWVTIDRSEALNAMNTELWRALLTEVRALALNTDARVLILRGSGERAFISGADVAEFPSVRADAEMASVYDRMVSNAVDALIEAPQPTVAMINGLCLGGGVLLALMCDLRIAADHAQFSVPAARLGLAYPLEHGVERLINVVGPAHAADLLFSGRLVDADEASRMGLVNRVVPREELEPVTREYALTVAEGAPLSAAAHKLEIRQSLFPPSQRDIHRVREAINRCLNSDDYQEGIAAFLEKRTPRFTGK